MLEPLEDRVVIRPHRPKDASPRGTYAPDSGQNATFGGTVIAVGPGPRPHTLSASEAAAGRGPTKLSVGDEVICDHYAKREVEHNGERLIILHESQVLAKVK